MLSWEARSGFFSTSLVQISLSDKKINACANVIAALGICDRSTFPLLQNVAPIYERRKKRRNVICSGWSNNKSLLYPALVPQVSVYNC